MAIFFVILALVLGLIMVYLFRMIKQVNLPMKKVSVSTETSANFADKIANLNGSPTFSITLTSEELTALTQAGISATGFSLKDIQVVVTTQDLEIYGKLLLPFSSDVKIYADPMIESGKVHFKIKSISAGKLTLPGLLSNQIEKALNQLLDQNLANLYQNYQAEQVSLQSDKMMISGKLKNSP